MEVEYEWTEEDVATLAQFADRSAAAGGRGARSDWIDRWYGGLILALWLFSILVVGLSSAVDLPIADRDFAVAFAVSAVWTAVLAGKGIWDRRTARGVGSHIVAANQEYGFLGPIRVTVDVERVREQGNGYAVEAQWAKVVRLDRREKFAFLTLALGWVVTIPRRAFASEADFNDFCRLAEGFWRAAHPEAVVR